MFESKHPFAQGLSLGKQGSADFSLRPRVLGLTYVHAALMIE